MIKIYSKLWDTLEILVNEGVLTEFERNSIKAMCDEVASSLAMNYTKVKEGVDDVMSGEILDYEAKRIAIDSEIKAQIRHNIPESDIIDGLISDYQLTFNAAKEAVQRVKANSIN